jgi:mannose-6-phosphate isomerase-like protein (cupin superfamily)
MTSHRPRPRVFALREAAALPNSPSARSARIVTPRTSGSRRLFAGMFWSEPGSTGGWAFLPDDPDEGKAVEGVSHLGEHDEVYLCLAGRVAVDWNDGSFEFGEGDVVFFPAGYTYHTRVLGIDRVRVFYVMAPAPDWMPPLEEAGMPSN